MRYYIATEFIADNRTIDLVSIGVVREDGREFYAQSCEFDPRKASQWVIDNVLNKLVECPYVENKGNTKAVKQHARGQCIPMMNETERHRCPWRNRATLREEIRQFIGDDDKPVFYGDCCAFDFVVLAQLFGTMDDWPKGWPWYFHDIQQMYGLAGIAMPTQNGFAHNALADVYHIKLCHEVLARR